MKTSIKRAISVLVCLVIYLTISFGMKNYAQAATAGEIDASANATLEHLYKDVKGAKDLVDNADGVLVFPNVYKAGLVIGGEYGEGALRINGKTVDYYSTATGSIGWQLGAQKKSIVILFMNNAALNRFRNSENWKAGVDASITLVAIGADGSIDTAKTNKPIIAFVIGQKGLMYNLTLEGSKFNKLKK